MEPRDTAIAPSREDIVRAIDDLVDAYRAVALWSLRPDYYPHTDVERCRVLDTIQKHGDVEAFQRAARLREWLSRHSSGTSAGF